MGGGACLSSSSVSSPSHAPSPSAVTASTISTIISGRMEEPLAPPTARTSKAISPRVAPVASDGVGSGCHPLISRRSRIVILVSASIVLAVASLISITLL